jgi:hypothetical protein
MYYQKPGRHPARLCLGRGDRRCHPVQWKWARVSRARLDLLTNPGVFVPPRSFAFNILKANRTDTLSPDRYRTALAGIDTLFKLLDSP